MTNTDTPAADFDPSAAAERYRQVAEAADAALSHMHTSLTLAEAQLAVVRHHQTHRHAQDVAAG